MSRLPFIPHRGALLRRCLLSLGALFILPAMGEPAADGQALFEEKCAMCHREAGMGTGLLQRRMDPAIAKLEQRTDLTPAFVALAARIGIGNMPRIPRGEVSDAQMQAIGEYLARGTSDAPPPTAR